MFESDKKSPLDRLKKGLYSRNDVFEEPSRHQIHGVEEKEIPKTWNTETDSSRPEDPLLSQLPHKTKKVYRVAFLASVFFLTIAFLIGVYTLFGGRNFISANNVDILIEGPVTIGGGEPLSLNASVVNKNSTDIELVDLRVEFPEGSKEANNPTQDLSNLRLSLGDIRSQSLAQRTIDALLYGEEGVEREIKFIAEYRTAGSNAIFLKEKTYKITISSSPINVSISALDKVLGGQASDITVTITSNTTVPVRNLMLSVDYPFGFTVISSKPEASFANNVWKIGDLPPGAKRIITIKASTDGQNEEERTLRANVGIQSVDNEREIATTIVSRDHTYMIERPFLGVDLTLNGERSDIAADRGGAVNGVIFWTNNSANKITSARIEAKLAGASLDKNSVRVDNGFYDSLNNTIVWEAGRTEGLDNIAPGQTGQVSFTFSSMGSAPGQSIANQLISVSVSASGSRIDDSGSPQEIATAVSRSVKIVSNLSLSARAVRWQGSISNSGPMPPRVDQETTYTIVWTVTNSSNNITGAKVTAKLPQYVKWTDVISPSDANISYNPTGGIVTWNVGSVPRNTDSGSGAKQVEFQISIRPSANQVNTVPEILSVSEITGTDAFAGITLQNSASTLTTRLLSDPSYKPGDDVVQP